MIRLTCPHGHPAKVVPCLPPSMSLPPSHQDGWVAAYAPEECRRCEEGVLLTTVRPGTAPEVRRPEESREAEKEEPAEGGGGGE